MKHFVDIREIKEVTVIIETGIDDEKKSARKAKKIAQSLYDEGAISVNPYEYGSDGLIDFKIKVKGIADDLDNEYLRFFGVYNEKGELL